MRDLKEAGSARPTAGPAQPRAKGKRGWALATCPALILLGCAGEPAYPVISPPAATVFQAPSEAVWNAALQSLGIAPLRMVDRAEGHIVTEQFSYTMPVQAGGGGRQGSVATQTLWISMDISVRPTAEGFTAVQAQTTIHHAMTYGFWPGAGGPNSPEGDLFARIAAHLNQR